MWILPLFERKGEKKREIRYRKNGLCTGAVRTSCVGNGIMYGIFNMNVTHIFSIVVIFNKYV